MSTKVYSKEISNEIKNFLDKDEWDNYTFNEERGIFTLFLGMSGTLKQLRIMIDVCENDYLVLAISPVGAESNDNQTMTRLAEFICRVNYGLKNGAFELKFDDVNAGEIRYRTYVDCEDRLPSEAIIRNSIYIAVTTFDKYAGGIVDVIFSGWNAADAIAAIDGTFWDDIVDVIVSDTDSVDDESADISEINSGSETDTNILPNKVKFNLFDEDEEGEES